MQTEKILQSDVLDIIFENKNKSYGAYALRKFYNNRLYKALGATLLLVVLLCSFTLMKPEAKPIFEIPVTGGVIITEVQKNKPKEKPVEIEKKKQNAPKQAPAIAKIFTKPRITTNPDVKPLQALNPSDAISDTDIKVPGNIATKVGVLPSLGLDTAGTAKTIIKPVLDILTPTETADVMPSYPGGMKALYEFLRKNLVNPQDLEEGENVSVKIKFIVGYDGKLKGFETVEDGGSAFNNEVIRVLKKMPNWIPGKIGTDNVSVYHTIPVKFISQEGTN